MYLIRSMTCFDVSDYLLCQLKLKNFIDFLINNNIKKKLLYLEGWKEGQ